MNKDRLSHGEQHSNARLTADEVVELRMKYAAGASQRELAKQYGIRPNVVSKIVTGERWRRVGGPIKKQARKWKRMTKIERQQAIELARQGMPYEQIAKALRFSATAISTFLKKHGKEFLT
jgi:predicted transcriptional regulator